MLGHQNTLTQCRSWSNSENTHTTHSRGPTTWRTLSSLPALSSWTYTCSGGREHNISYGAHMQSESGSEGAYKRNKANKQTTNKQSDFTKRWQPRGSMALRPRLYDAKQMTNDNITNKQTSKINMAFNSTDQTPSARVTKWYHIKSKQTTLGLLSSHPNEATT